MTSAMPSSLAPGHAAALRPAQTDAELRACWPVMRQLRPQLASADDFVARVHRMRADRYHVLAAWRGDAVVALGGYHLMENLIYGRFLYVDDLVTHEAARGQGWGGRLIDAMTAIAEAAGCASLVLDTALSNVDAQRFYTRCGLANRATRFSRALAAGVAE